MVINKKKQRWWMVCNLIWSKWFYSKEKEDMPKSNTRYEELYQWLKLRGLSKVAKVLTKMDYLPILGMISHLTWLCYSRFLISSLHNP